MTKQFYSRVLVASMILMLFTFIFNAGSLAQTTTCPATTFTEAVGNASGTGIAISSWTSWTNGNGYTMTGDGTVTNANPNNVSANWITPPSTLPSDNGSVSIGPSGKYWKIDGINTSGYTNLQLQIDIWKGSGNIDGSDLVADISDGTTTNRLTMTAISGSGPASVKWYRIIYTNGTYLAGSAISIKFTNLNNGTAYQVDNVTLSGQRTLAAPTGSGQSRCDAGTLTLTATAPSGILNWYAASIGGSSLGTGTSFTTPSISATTTYYVDVTYNGCTSARTAVTATVNATPHIISTTGGLECNGGTAVLGATADAGTLNWYGFFPGAPILGTGTSFTTPNSGITTYYVSATSNGCTSSFTAVHVTVSTSPAAPVSGGNKTGNPGEIINLQVTVGTGETANWYATATGGSILSGGTGVTSFPVSQSLDGSYTYYAEAQNSSGCRSLLRSAVTLTVNVLWATGSVTNTIVNTNSGNVGIGTTTPQALLHIDGGGLLVTGGTTSTVPISGAGTRLMWIPSKAAFRAGSVQATEWDNGNIGSNSFAVGSNNIASGLSSSAFGDLNKAIGDYSVAFGSSNYAKEAYSIAFGSNTKATGTGAIAFGNSTTASGSYSTAFGSYNTAAAIYSTVYGDDNSISSTALFSTVYGSNNSASAPYTTVYGTDNTASSLSATCFGDGNIASGDYSTAYGESNTASGKYSTALGAYNAVSGDYSFVSGIGNNSKSYNSFVTGQYNIDNGNSSSWIASDPLFIIGNGLSAYAKNNAVTVLKNGNVGIGTPTPNTNLEVVGTTNPAIILNAENGTSHAGMVLGVASCNTCFSNSAVTNDIVIGSATGLAENVILQSKIPGKSLKFVTSRASDGYEGVKMEITSEGIVNMAGSLNVAGTTNFAGFKLGTSTTSGYVLTADNTGLGTWQPLLGGQISIPNGTGMLTFSNDVRILGKLHVGNSSLVLDGNPGSSTGNEIYNDGTQSVKDLILQSNALNLTGNTILNANAGNTGSVGIGTSTPSSLYKLDVNGIGNFTGLRMHTGADVGKVLISDADGNASWSDRLFLGTNSRQSGYLEVDGDGTYGFNIHSHSDNVSTPTKLFVGSSTNNNTTTDVFYVTSTGKTKIGAKEITTGSHTNYQLGVYGKIVATSIYVIDPNASDWADYVFDKNYKLTPLKELENFIAIHKHLPDVPTTADVKENGVNLSEMNILLLKKVEELTLHLIEMDKKIEAMQKEKENINR